MSSDEDHVSTAIDGAHFVANSNGFNEAHNNEIPSDMNFDIEIGGDRRTTIDSIEMLALAAEDSGTSTIKREFRVPTNRNEYQKTRSRNVGGMNPECFDLQDDAPSS